MFEMSDFLRHIILSLHPISFTFMVIKELIDVGNNYWEIYDWLGNFIGISYYFLFSALLKKKEAERSARF